MGDAAAIYGPRGISLYPWHIHLEQISGQYLLTLSSSSIMVDSQRYRGTLDRIAGRSTRLIRTTDSRIWPGQAG